MTLDMDTMANNVVITPTPDKEQSEDHEPLVRKILQIYDSISKLPSLKPSKDVDTLFTDLVTTCIPPINLDINTLPPNVQSTRSKLIRICAEAEGHLESHYSTLIGSFDNPLDHLHLFPYYNNYLKLSLLEYTILVGHTRTPPSRVAFVGSGPMPLTSIVLAREHMRSATFHNYDIDAAANAQAERLVGADPDLSERMFFHTGDVMEVGDELRVYDVVFLAALVGMDREEKGRVVKHLARHMAPGAVLMLRSAAGARAFLYPVVEEGDLGGCFQVLSEYHPVDEMINSVIIARRTEEEEGGGGHHHHVEQGMVLPCKCCSEVRGFGVLNGVLEELAVEEA